MTGLTRNSMMNIPQTAVVTPGIGNSPACYSDPRTVTAAPPQHPNVTARATCLGVSPLKALHSVDYKQRDNVPPQCTQQRILDIRREPRHGRLLVRCLWCVDSLLAGLQRPPSLGLLGCHRCQILDLTVRITEAITEMVMD